MAKSKRAKRVLTHVLGGSATPVLPITDVIGATPRERLAWLLEFAYLDLQSIDRAAHSALWGLLAGLVKDATRGQWRVPDSERPEREAFRLLKSGRPFESDKDPWYPGRLDLVQAWVRRGIHSSGNIHHIRDIEIVYFEPSPGAPYPSRLERALRDFHFQGGLPDGVMVALATLRAEVPPSLVRQCLWPTSDGRCLRFFVATKRQKWCPLHQDAARRERDRRAQERFRERRTLKAKVQSEPNQVWSAPGGEAQPSPALVRGTAGPASGEFEELMAKVLPRYKGPPPDPSPVSGYVVSGYLPPPKAGVRGGSATSREAPEQQPRKVRRPRIKK